MRSGRSSSLLFLGLLLLSGRAEAYAVPSDSNGLRPHIGAIANITGTKSQFAMGVDWEYSLTGPLLFDLGFDVGVANEFVGLEFNAGVKYRFLQVHPRVAPFIRGGVGFSLGFPTRSNTVITGLGFRFGFGIDFFATQRVIPGFDVVFDVGPRFSPNVGPLGTAQIMFGVTFLL